MTGTPELRALLSDEEGSPFKPSPTPEELLQTQLQAKTDISPAKYLPTEFPAAQQRLASTQRGIKRAADGALLESFVIRPGKKPKVEYPHTTQAVIRPLCVVGSTPPQTPNADLKPFMLTLFSKIPELKLEEPLLRPKPKKTASARIIEFKAMSFDERDPEPRQQQKQEEPTRSRRTSRRRPKLHTGQVYYRTMESSARTTTVDPMMGVL